MPYLFTPPTNHICALDYAEGLKRCAACNAPLNKEDCRIELPRKPGRSKPIAHTTDGFLIANSAFKARYEAEGWHGLTFNPMSNGNYDVRVSRVVKVLHINRYLYATRTPWDPEFDDHYDVQIVVEHSDCCSACGQYKNKAGFGAHVIARGELPVGPVEFVMSDVALGFGDEAAPQIIVGDGIRTSHRTNRLRRTSVYGAVFYQSWRQTDTEPLRLHK
ncbi:MAG: hypothetical protein AB8B47_14375 [Roseobacter sp.]